MAPRRQIDVTHPNFFGVELPPDRVSDFQANARRSMISTSFFDEDAMKTLSLYDEALRLFRRIGWGTFFENSWDTYKGPTLEMLSTYKMKTERRTIPNKITFRAGNTEYELATIRINDYFDAPARGIYKQHDNFMAANFWPYLVGPRTPAFSSGSSSTSSVRNLVF